jgi:hypothetical protein
MKAQGYGMKNLKGDMGQARKPMKIDAFAAQQKMNKNLKVLRDDSRGNPPEAWNYKF